MKDLHTHILFGIDDGASNLEESIEMLKKLQENGVTDVMLTPHYIEKSIYNCNNKEKEKIFKKIKEELKQKNLNINIYLGNEVMINNNLITLLKDEITTLNGSRYLLIELPMNNEFKDLDLIIKELIQNKIIPIIAHPERYYYVIKDHKWVKNYLEMGVLFQGNYESLFGKYGYHCKKTLKKLLKINAIHFLGSDIHKKNATCNLNKLNKKLKRIIKDEKTIKKLTNDNFTKVIKNELI